MPLVERRYAEALIALAVERNAIDTYQEELQLAVDTIVGHSELKFVLINPEVKLEAKKNIIKKLFSESIRSELLNFLLLLQERGRIAFLSGIMRQFIVQADRIRNTLAMTIISTVPLQEDQLNKIKEKYQKLYNASSVKAVVEIDTSLIGGIKIKVGDKIVDGTVKGRLESLKQFIIQG